ncbi:hypothetical protein [Sphingobacterium faecium]|uniref:hypothetical protein n=1 Tax=Sphingobacterium faecium TaxID=34087 RepID=UPI00247A7AFE|nr:hypothetical protein [Sphingobacterium faecium]WGQ15581.1 hypothetical protein QG727_04035 [Sphingobacterium faecium]
MKDKLLSALKTKYKNLGFGDKTFSGVADFLATTVTEEDQVETAISGVEGLLKAFQGDVDTRVNSAVAKAKADNKGGEITQPAKETLGGDDPVLKLLQEMRQDITTLKSEKQQDTLAQKWAKAVEGKGIKNDKLRDKWLPKTEEEFDDSLNDLIEFNKTISIQEANNNSTGRPASGASTGAVPKETQSKIDNWKGTKETAKEN